MVTSNHPNPTATVVPAATENNVSAPPVNDNVCAQEAEPDVQNKGDLESLLLQRNKSLTELQELHSTLLFDLNTARLKTKLLEKDCFIFRTTCKKSATQSVTPLNLEIIGLKDLAKTQEKSKQNLLKLKDIKFKETLALYRNNLKANTKLKAKARIAGLQKNHNLQVITISTMNGDLMAKICECNLYKNENKYLTAQVTTFEKRSLDIDKRKMEHVLQLKLIVLETEALKVQKVEQTKVLKDQTNQQEHKRKLQTIFFTAKTRQKGKDKDQKRKHIAKQKKFQGGSNQMGLLWLCSQPWDNSHYQDKFFG